MVNCSFELLFLTFTPRAYSHCFIFEISEVENNIQNVLINLTHKYCQSQSILIENAFWGVFYGNLGHEVMNKGFPIMSLMAIQI